MGKVLPIFLPFLLRRFLFRGNRWLETWLQRLTCLENPATLAQGWMYFACVVYTLNYVSEWRTKVIGLFHRIPRDNRCCKRSVGFGRTFDCCFLNPGVTSVMLDKVSPGVHTLVVLSASPYLGARWYREGCFRKESPQMNKSFPV